MNVKAIVAVGVAVGLGALTTAVGCGGDDCTKAADHLAECLNQSSSNSTNDTASPSVTCEGTTKCVAQAVNAASCDEIRDAYSMKPTTASKSFSDAIDKCASTGSL